MENCASLPTASAGKTSRPDLYAKRGMAVRLIYLLASFLYWPWAHLMYKNRTVVLCYHGITDRQRDRFKSQMRRLLRILHKDGCASSRVMVTFDDAFANLLQNAIPILEELQIPCRIFVPTGNLGSVPGWIMPSDHPDRNEPVMDAEQIAIVSRNPLVTLGSHTMSHPDLTAIPDSEARRELADSKAAMERLTARPADSLALPHGAFNPLILQLARQAGYRQIFTLEEKTAHLREEEVIGRFLMSPEAWMIEFILTCKGAYSWLYNLRKCIRSLRHRFGKR